MYRPELGNAYLSSSIGRHIYVYCVCYENRSEGRIGIRSRVQNRDRGMCPTFYDAIALRRFVPATDLRGSRHGLDSGIFHMDGAHSGR